jgi:hypothetical protein
VAVFFVLVAALLAAAALELPGLIATLLAAYVLFVALLGLETWTLSPLHAVDSSGLALEGAGFLAIAAGAWWLRGRPGLELARAPGVLRLLARDSRLRAPRGRDLPAH